LELDDLRAKQAAKSLQTELQNITNDLFDDTMLRSNDQDKLQEQEKLIQKLTAELSELRKECHPSAASVMTVDSDNTKDLKGNINFTMNAMLDHYESLDN
jgi:hypothetical protein